MIWKVVLGISSARDQTKNYVRGKTIYFTNLDTTDVTLGQFN